MLPFILLTLYILVFYWHGIFTNDSTPGGDARRVAYYVQLSRNTEEYMPLWEPHVSLGTPIMADPERFFYTAIAPIFTIAEKSNYNLAFNIILASLLILHGISIFLFSRNLGLSRAGSVVAGSLASSSGIVYVHYLSGRINTMMSLTLIMLVLVTYRYWRKYQVAFLYYLLGAMIGLHILLNGHYSLVPLIMLFVYAVSLESTGNSINMRSVAEVAGKIFILVVIGVCIWLVALYPLVDYQLNAVVGEKGWGKQFKYPTPVSLPNLIFPFDTRGHLEAKQKIYPYISILLIPGLWIYFFRKKYEVRDNNSIKYLYYLALVCMALTLLMPVMSDIYEKIPLINLIRHSFSYTYISGLMLLIVSIYAIENSSISRFLSRSNFNIYLYAFSAILGIVFIALMFLDASSAADLARKLFSIEISVKSHYWENLVRIISGMLGLGILTIVYMYYKNKMHKVYIIFIGALVFQLLIPAYPALNAKRTGNHSIDKNIIEVLASDRDYYRINCHHTFYCPPLGLPQSYGTNGFSLFLSEEQKNSLYYLTSQKVKVKRPHWFVESTECNQIDHRAARLLNIKYLMCEHKSQHENIPSNKHWEMVFDDGNIGLWRMISFEQSLRIMDSWTVRNIPADKEDVISAWSGSTLLLEKAPSKGEYALNPNDTVDLVSHGYSGLDIEVKAGNHILLLVPVMYSKYWKAFINGAETEILRAYGALQVISVPPGSNKIQFRYYPESFQIGLYVSLVTLAVITVLLLLNIYGSRSRIKSGQNI